LVLPAGSGRGCPRSLDVLEEPARSLSVQVEVWFSILQGQSLSGASFTSLKQLQQHIDAFIKAYNDKAEPFAWTKKKVRQRRFKGSRITQL
jgi:hypothetical protein